MLLLFFFQSGSYFLPLLFFFIFKRKNEEKIVRVILFYIIYCILQEFLTYLFSFILPQFQSLVFYLFGSYTIIEFTFFCIFYNQLFPVGHPMRKLVKVILPAFSIFAIIDFFVINKAHNFDSLTIGIESLILLFFCGYYLYYQVITTMTMFVYRTFNFWIIVTFLIFVSSTFFLYIMADAMMDNPEFQKYYVIINTNANILKNILLCFAITRKPILSPELGRKQKSVFKLDLGDEFVLQKNLQT